MERCSDKINSGVYAAVYISILLLLLPLDWVAAIAFAATIHELSHIASVILLNGSIKDVQFGLRGITMRADGLSDCRCMLAVVVGPAASIFLNCFHEIYPKLAFCGLCQGIFNLIPISPSDGWNMCNLICRKIAPENYAERIMVVFEQIVIWSFLVVSIWSVLVFHSSLPLYIDAIILAKKIPVKIPCKQRKQRVQ